MLQQILKDMYIDPELLEELSEEQKQILFMKMREEQIRRYQEAEHGGPAKRTPTKVSFLMDARNEPWTWVMGEAEGDLSYEEMVATALEQEEQEQKRKDEEDARKAKELAEQQLKEEALKAEKAREERRKIRQQQLSEEHERLRRQQREFEEQLQRQDELYKNAEEARLMAQKVEEEKKRLEQIRLVEERKLQERLKAEEERDRLEQKAEQERLEKEAQKRSEEIYVNIRTLRLQREEEEKKREEAGWKMQQEKAKAFDKERQVSFHRAKEHRRKSKDYEEDAAQLPGDVLQQMRELSRTSHEQPQETIATRKGTPPSIPKTARPGTGTLPAQAKIPTRPVVMGTGSLPRHPSPRGARPNNRGEVIQWFKEVEWPRRVVCTSKGQICPWFHGILSRAQAEHLLDGKPNGTFLIRVSERIWGYTVSVSSAHRIKHFLIDAAMPGRYQFFGENQKSHPDLHSLIEFHRKYPISVAGQELLMTPQSQIGKRPDYQELMT